MPEILSSGRAGPQFQPTGITDYGDLLHVLPADHSPRVDAQTTAGACSRSRSSFDIVLPPAIVAGAGSRPLFHTIVVVTRLSADASIA
jgi:hypothetical protein